MARSKRRATTKKPSRNSFRGIGKKKGTASRYYVGGSCY